MSMILIIAEQQSKLNEKQHKAWLHWIEPLCLPTSIIVCTDSLLTRNLLECKKSADTWEWGEEGKKRQTFLLQVTMRALKYISWEGFRKSV